MIWILLGLISLILVAIYQLKEGPYRNWLSVSLYIAAVAFLFIGEFQLFKLGWWVGLLFFVFGIIGFVISLDLSLKSGYIVNVNIFNKYLPEISFVLGFFCATLTISGFINIIYQYKLVAGIIIGVMIAAFIGIRWLVKFLASTFGQ